MVKTKPVGVIAKSCIAFCLSLIFYKGLFAQNDSQDFPDIIFTKAEIAPIFKGNLFNYIDSALKAAELPKKGRVMIEVVIDSNGVPKCKSLLANTGGSISNLGLEELINKMPKWTPAYQHEHPVNYLRILFLDFSDKKLIQVLDINMDEEINYPYKSS